ncbi:alpha/beta hydrolase [Synechococcus sp. PCC 7335]|uniref:alpha/beta hydrolase n=1 Tax=Synechococcus sp. (strain ATCC 29403 / PCC 7335) TaxID=91464 RepID=UPI001D0D794D|nr:alpha/beta hydrolase [Synechococcus sp. PCC 7335]
MKMLKDFTWGNTPDEMRRHFREGFSLPSHPTAKIQPVHTNGVAAELISMPSATPEQVILYLHGGGFAVGSCETHRRIACDMAEASVCDVLLIDYRLAPEHPFPAALKDTLSAYHWLIDTRGYQPGQVAIVGDSAGGNLALTMMLSLKAAGAALPSSAVLISPYTDLARTGKTINTHADLDPMVSPQLLETITAWYTSCEQLRHPLVSPLYANLSGLPPLLIQVGATELLLDDALQLSRQVGLANVAVELKVWQNMIHCFQLFAPILTEGRQAISEASDFLNRHFQQPESS